MIKENTNNIDDILESLPPDAKVIDVGGSYAPFNRADVIIDIIPFEDIRFNQARGKGKARITKENYIQFDICSKNPWPIKDKTFDYSICTRMLEDIRDPIGVCSEIVRVSKAGYIEVPSKFYETTFGLEIKGLAGASHHRWIVDIFEGKLRFTFKHLYVHKKFLNKNKNKFDVNDEKIFLHFEWKDDFQFFENHINDGGEIFEYLLGRKISEKEKWAIYRKCQDRNFIINWLAYFKNTNNFFAKIFQRIKGRKDFISYTEHNKDYEGQFGIDSFRKVKTRYETENKFEIAGFRKAIDKSGNKDIHIDIGSGGGWLLFKTSPLFKRVIGIEPSKAACDNVSTLIKECDVHNIELINSDMTDAIKGLHLQIPVFFTTAVVLSHIRNFCVKEFLQLLNTDAVPMGSTFYFCERYDKNIQQRLWYIRRKYWWAKNLPEWQLEFFDIEDNGYKGGIYGKKVGRNNVKNTYAPTMKENISWFLDGIRQKIMRIGRFIKRSIKI